MLNFSHFHRLSDLMKNLPSAVLLASLLLSFSSCGRAQAPAAQPDGSAAAKEVVERVMMSRALGNDKDNKPVIFPGSLTKGNTKIPFNINVTQTLIHFSFDNPKQTIRLDTTEKGYRLREVTAGSNKEVPSTMYSSGVRGTDLTYDDISMRYLYWPKKAMVGEETIKTRRCDVVDLFNPQKLGDYYLVRIFADKESGGLMRMMGFDWNGKLIKSCTVTEGMKLKNGATVMKTMEVVSYIPGTKKVAGETTFELKRP
jgi:hypothetical protein